MIIWCASLLHVADRAITFIRMIRSGKVTLIRRDHMAARYATIFTLQRKHDMAFHLICFRSPAPWDIQLTNTAIACHTMPTSTILFWFTYSEAAASGCHQHRQYAREAVDSAKAFIPGRRRYFTRRRAASFPRHQKCHFITLNKRQEYCDDEYNNIEEAGKPQFGDDIMIRAWKTFSHLLKSGLASMIIFRFQKVLNFWWYYQHWRR